MNYKDIQIVFEDNHILVAIKPQNVPCQADSSGDKDMLTLLKEYLVEKYNKPGDAWLGLVHRLDRPTSGLMVFAKTSKAASRLSEMIRQGEVEKKYLCVVDGVPKYKADKLQNFIKKFPDINTVRVVPETTDGAKYAELDFRLLQSVDNKSLLYVNLITGRGHQIRVQMAHAGTPITGDHRYGKGESDAFQLALFATDLKFKHPVGGQLLAFRAYPPEIMPWTAFDIDAYMSVTIKNN